MLTNPKIQRVGSLISFFTDHWKVSTKPVGADLGQGQFQFQFANEKDLQQVLDDRPYHFAYWMLILQQETLRSIANYIGHYESMEITATTARMKVHIDGLQPLITSSMVEFETGEEVEATLIYEKLEKHCIKCMSLLHDAKDCPTFKSEELREEAAPSNPPRYPPRHRDHRGFEPIRYRTSQDQTGSIRELDQGFRSSSPRQANQAELSKERSGSQNSNRGYNYIPRSREFSNPDSSALRHSDLRNSLDASRSQFSAQSRRYERYEERRQPPPQSKWVEKEKVDTEIRERLSGDLHSAISGSSRQRRPPLDTQSPRISPDQLPREAFNAALNEVRDVMHQYSSCADPSESAARKERLRQAEQRGQIEETAAQMVRASMATQTQDTLPVENPESRSVERIPATQRLGPAVSPERVITEENHLQKSAASKRKPGRPPGRKNGDKAKNNTLIGASSRKRKIQQTALSPRKRKDSDLSRRSRASLDSDF
ncbi:unnamed protein product [Microthlaspi erraticum]|uniref:DUF4283 domain-containing protein n=1 Tax=Microthlaspi erraticum TaxID=1685480 RepID=A0A6D2HVV1_9BRAS|nr:unnamed protein product [Microthlaspi erraticum]